ncbi:hypothetical protein GCM10022251_53790 [Phytohabitans flavus]|uniref:GPP34 family phosphoprotein n=1 Tax=Phytohabitans flavus TaxID=1076124 RepID=A0A6F8XLZ1_9ACTN|nr:GPP34 family phosphoprotein [Phytohabitans flavus]BCB74844.1 hypothetical protein Pflav_012540 [Phytohabitans flavus]
MAHRPGEVRLGPPTLAEDLLLLLFQPDPGIIAGESTLTYVLAGAAFADLGLGSHVRYIPGMGGSTRMEAVADHPPADDVLRVAWDHIAAKPWGVQAALVAIGPVLRSPLIDRLARRGDIRRFSRETLGRRSAEVLEDGGSGRRAVLLSGVREALVDAAEPQPRIAALAALLWASGTLARFEPDIPWTADVIDRAKHLERGVRGAHAAAEAIARTVTGSIVNNIVIAAAVLPAL